jgi:hypothetical protein
MVPVSIPGFDILETMPRMVCACGNAWNFGRSKRSCPRCVADLGSLWDSRQDSYRRRRFSRPRDVIPPNVSYWLNEMRRDEEFD